nr:unnamed protein product [Spirometra erinaceieuropaei]
MDEQENETTTPAVQPYFVESFAFILEHICQEKIFKHLFDDTDEKFMSSFKKLTGKRSRGFFRQSKLRIDPAPGDLAAALLELLDQGFLSSDLSSFSIDELLNTLERKEDRRMISFVKIERVDLDNYVSDHWGHAIAFRKPPRLYSPVPYYSSQLLLTNAARSLNPCRSPLTCLGSCLHCESRVFVTLFGLLFYDLLFAQSPDDVFYSMRQTAPLDLFTDDFYVTRQSAVEMRLELIARAERMTNAQLIIPPPSSPPRSIGEDDLEALFMDPVSRLLTSVWTEHHGERCIGVSWDLFSSVSEVVVRVCPPLLLTATDYRNWQSGLPDLCLWSPSHSKAKLVEVKGPGDSLSCQQMVWIDKLISFGADVVLCTVSAISRNSLDFKQ